ncbi:vWA domain-containing protein [Paenibacillus lentus]|uniref:VWA domain-containing protein n=1 Tax=Paenibacillus lentus TaxID=1338368 RepID=A0A3Q8SDW0_9BACL|nr:VWA domain-containing protein [Paenibacillus lentus]AZK48299.1 VWA domain-containing protein [Paenibacillus lentus]
MMGFSSWTGLWFALAIPLIVLMYLFKRKYVDTLIPSHLLWNRVLRNIEANRPWQKLQNRLLLWLQLLVAALLVFALMMPFVWVKGGLEGHTVIIVDVSASMGAAWNGETEKDTHSTRAVIDELKQQVGKYIESMGANSEVTLLKLGMEPEILLTREKNQLAIRAQVDQLTVEYGKAAYRETMSLAVALTKGDPDARLIIFTDEQWSEMTNDIPLEVPVEVVSLRTGAANNAAVDQFGVKSDGEIGTGVAVIRNHGVSPVETDLELFGDGKRLAVESVKVKNGEAVTVTFEELPAADFYKLKLGLSDDYMPDNEAFAFRKRGGAPSVLLISQGNLFLEKALQLSGARVTRMEPSTSTASASNEEAAQAPAIPKDKPDLIIIDGKPPAYIEKGEWPRLVKETPSWTLGGDGETIQPPNGRTTIFQHPVTRYISLNDPPTGTLLAREIPVWGKPLIAIGAKTAAFAGTEGGVNRLVFLFSLSDGDLPLRPEFPVMVNNAVQWLQAGRTTGLGRVIAGSPLEIPVTAEAVEGAWIAVDGYAMKAGAAPIPAITKDQSLPAEQTVPEIPGLWRFEPKGADGSPLPGYNLEVIAHPSESALGQAKPLVFGGDGNGNSMGSDGTPANGGSSEISISEESKSKRSLTSLAVLLALIVIITEWGVYQRGRSI